MADATDTMLAVLEASLEESAEAEETGSLYDQYIAKGRADAGAFTYECMAATDAALATLTALTGKYHAAGDERERLAYQSGLKSDRAMGDIARASKALVEALVTSRRYVRFWHKANAKDKDGKPVRDKDGKGGEFVAV